MKLPATLPGDLDMAIRKIPRIQERHCKVLFHTMKDCPSIVRLTGKTFLMAPIS